MLLSTLLILALRWSSIAHACWTTETDMSSWCREHTDTDTHYHICAAGFEFMELQDLKGSMTLRAGTESTNVTLGVTDTSVFMNIADSRIVTDHRSLPGSPEPFSDTQLPVADADTDTGIVSTECQTTAGVDAMNAIRDVSSPLVCVAGLSEQAFLWNLQMCNVLGELAHGDVVSKCVDGMAGTGTRWASCAENVLYSSFGGPAGVLTAVRQWSQSRDHGSTMRNAKYKLAGFNMTECPDGRFYATSLFVEPVA